MRPILIVLLALALGACAVYPYGGGYYQADGHYQTDGYYQADGYGDYYYGRAPVVPYMGVSWYDPYDALFWGLRYSYFDPFWYPHFHYGVTFFPRYYYGWPHWHAGSYWSWRGYHPYSPYYGSYWDHYYHWHRPSDPRRPLHGGGRNWANNGSERFGSARNAAERMAASGGRYGQQGQPAVIGAQRSAGTASRGAYGRTDVHQRAMEPGLLPSSRYAPRQSRAGADSFQRASAGSGVRADGRQRSAAADAYAADRRGNGTRSQRGAGAEYGFRADGRQRGPAIDAYAPAQRADSARWQRGAGTDYGFRADGRQRGPMIDAYAPPQRADSAGFQRGDLAPVRPQSGAAPPPAFRTPEPMDRSAPPAPSTWTAPAPSSRSAPEMRARSAPAPSRSGGERSSPRSRSDR